MKLILKQMKVNQSECKSIRNARNSMTIESLWDCSPRADPREGGRDPERREHTYID